MLETQIILVTFDFAASLYNNPIDIQGHPCCKLYKSNFCKNSIHKSDRLKCYLNFI